MAKTAHVVERSATDMLRDDHRRVKELFKRFETSEGRQKKEAADAALRELEVHSKLEEKLFYPAARKVVDSQELIGEAEEEHQIIDGIIEELRGIRFDERYQEKFGILMRNVTQHIQVEENEILPQTEGAGIDLTELGGKMSELRDKLTGTVQRGRPRRLRKH